MLVPEYELKLLACRSNPMAEVNDLKSFQCGFDSHLRYGVGMVSTDEQDRMRYLSGPGFDSLLLHALIAQMVEQLTFNQRVAGSSPAEGTASR
jgi:hypothetical protein